MDLNRKIPAPRPLAWLLLFAGLTVLTSCGTNYNNGNQKTGATSKFKHRVFVTNAFAGTVLIFNAETNVIYNRPLGTASGNNLMLKTPDNTLTLVSSSNAQAIYFIDNATETVTSGAVSLPGVTESVAVLPDNKTALATLRNAGVSGQTAVGALVYIDITNRVVSNIISVPEARRLVLNNDGTKALIFSDDSDSISILDVAAKTVTSLPGFDRPVNAIFSTDNTKAYVLNCGGECGGTTASVQTLTMAGNVLGTPTVVSAATKALLDGGKLYVAGTPPGSATGTLQVVDTTTMAASAPVQISDGRHDVMALTSNGRLYIGAKSCSNAVVGGAIQGCLSIFNTSDSRVAIPSIAGDINAVQPLSVQNMVYVIQAGELVYYDPTTDAPFPTGQFDIVGAAGTVLQID
jgi:hypothetical protein